MHLLDVRADDMTHDRPDLRGGRSAAEAGIEPHEFRSPAGEYETEYAGQQPKVDHCPARCMLISATHLADGAAGVPIIGHAPDSVPIHVLGVAGMRSEAFGQSFPDIPVRRGSGRWINHYSLASARPESRALVSSHPSRLGSS
jgi:hypothetical protein